MSATRLLLCAAVLAAGCGTTTGATDAADTADEASPGVAASATPPLFAGLCDAAAARAPGEAEETFARAHDGLHSLARELQDTGQRAVAGDLLEAKQQVEAAFGTDPTPPDLTDRLDRLVDATADALSASGHPPPSCPERSVP